MVKVPQYERQTQISTGQSARQNVSTPVEAFGGGIGGALAQVAGQVQAHADQMQKRIDQTAADEAFLEYTKQRNQILFMDQDAFYNLNGREAVDAYNPTVQKLEDLRKLYGNGLNATAASIFRNATDQDIAFSINNMASHSAKALRSWEKQTSESYLANLSDNMALLDNEAEYLVQEQAGLDYLFANADKLGLDDPETFQSFAKEWMSNARVKRVALMADADPVGALKYAEEHRDEFQPEAYSRMISNLRGRADPIIAQSAAERFVDELSGTAVVSFDTEVDRLIDEREGEALVIDNNGAPTKFGINKIHNPDVDVENLTRAQAKELYRKRYWEPIGGNSLPPHMAAAAFDAAVNQGVGRTKKWLEEANGDLAKFNALRLEAYKKHPEWNKYGKVWQRRIAETSIQAPPKKAIDVRANIPEVHAAIDADPTLTEAQKKLAKSAANGLIADKTITVQATQANYLEVAYGIAIGAPEGADAPTSLQQAMSNPDFARAYLALDVKTQDFIQTQIQQNARKKNPPMTAEFLALQSQFDVWATTNPDTFPGHEQILAEAKASADAGNPWPNSVLKHVLGLRTQLIKGDVKPQNAATQAAMGMRPVRLILEDIGLLKGNKIVDEEGYMQFWGRMDAHIKAYQALYKKDPDQAELIEMAGQLVTEKKFLGMTTGKGFVKEGQMTNTIIREVPDADIPVVVEELKRLGITRPTPQQIYEEWRRGQ